MSEPNNLITWNDFSKVEMRIGTIINAEIFKENKKPAYKLIVDLGEFGHRKTSAQITKLYEVTELTGKQVVCVVNFPPKQIANIMSECLILGGIENEGDVILLQPERKVTNGIKIG